MKAVPYYVLAIVAILVIGGLLYMKPEKYVSLPEYDLLKQPSLGGGYPYGTKSEYNTSMYQYSNPSLPRENDYYACLSQKCGGNTQDFACTEKCRLMVFRQNMGGEDTKDWVCFPYAFDEDAYYKCLSQVYADYKYP